MDFITALLLGLVQGLSEFLPVSSSGHLVMAQEVLGVDETGVLFEVALHVGTLAAVLWFYRSRIAALIVGAVRGDAGVWAYVGKLGVATLPAVVVVLLFRDFLEGLFTLPWVAGVALLVTAAVLWTTRRTLPGAELAEPGWLAALLIGCAQAAAIVPGISRSGATVAAGLALGVRSESAAEFSFLMSVAAIGGAAALSVGELGAVDSRTQLTLGVGVLMALLSGVLALTLFVRLLRTGAFHRFAYYDVVAGSLFLAWLALR